MEQRIKREVIATLIQARRPDLANVVAKSRDRAPVLIEREGYSDHYEMSLRNDRFIHFLPTENAIGVIKDGKLLEKPPGARQAGAIWAVSVIWGSFVPGVQLHHIEAPTLTAILFETNSMPKVGFPEEVVWNRDVVLKRAKLMKVPAAIALLKKAPHAIDSKARDFHVTYKP